MAGLTGIFTGIDTQTLVDGVLAANSISLMRMSNQTAKLTAEDKALAEFQERLVTLKSLADKLSGASGLKKVNVTSTDSTVAYADVNEARGEGSYLVEVAQLASSEKKVHVGLVTAETLVTAGVFEYQYDGQTIAINTTATTTLTDLQDLINNGGTNPGVTASILQYDDGAGGVYHLILSGDKSGSDYGITISGGTTIVAFQDTGSEWTVTSAAQDSKIRIDGYPSGDWIERSSNSITDVITGVTLNLVSAGSVATPESTIITLNRSTAELRQSLTDMAGMLNGLKISLDTYTKFSSENDTYGVLQGDYFLGATYNRIRDLFLQPLSGFEDGTDPFTMSAHIGLEWHMDKETYESSWIFREESGTSSETIHQLGFNEAIEADYEAVLDLIGLIAGGATDSTDIVFSSATERTDAGVYDIQIDYDGAGEVTAARIKLESESTYRDMEIDTDAVPGTTILRGVYGEGTVNPEVDLVIEIAQTGNNETLSYQVHVKRGFAAELSDRLDGMLDATTGTFIKKRESYQNDKDTGSIDRLEARMQTEQDRLQKMETYLIKKYARLEAELSRLDSQRGAFDAMFSSLITNKKD